MITVPVALLFTVVRVEITAICMVRSALGFLYAVLSVLLADVCLCVYPPDEQFLQGAYPELLVATAQSPQYAF